MVCGKQGEGAMRVLELCASGASMGWAFRERGHDVLTVDTVGSQPTGTDGGVLGWKFWETHPPGAFDLLWCVLPPPDERLGGAEGAHRRIAEVMGVLRHFRPARWYIVGPRWSSYLRVEVLRSLPHVDMDTCCFPGVGSRNRLRVWGGGYLKETPSRVCNYADCPHALERRRTGGGQSGAPVELLRYLLGWPQELEPVAVPFDEVEDEAWVGMVGEWTDPESDTGVPAGALSCDEGDLLRPEDMEAVRGELMPAGVHFVRGFVQGSDPAVGGQIEARRTAILKDYADSVFTERVVGDPPVRGQWGEAEIVLKPGVTPVKQRAFHLTGERRDAWVRLIDKLVADGRVEPGAGPWSSPSFPVPKKKPGEYRLVVDYRALNAATVDDAHPLPRIEEVLQRQGRHRMWSVLDLRDGFHQVPLKEESRNYTCMSTPRGTMRWKVLVMGLKNSSAVFQRVLEEVLRGEDSADVYIDDIIVGTSADNEEALVEQHDKDVRRVLDRLARAQLLVNGKKAELFMREVAFCGHLLRAGRRSPEAGKLAAVQRWALPRTVTQLRGFLGLTNYYSSYCPMYAELAAPLCAKLQLDRHEGRKGSNKVLVWTEEEKAAFEGLKSKLAASLELFQVRPDQPYRLRSDASRYAVGAVLEQCHEGQWVPVGFFSRKLTSSQKNWSPREQETYAIVASLHKWAGWIGLQPVVVLTDHQSLREWQTEHVDTPSGPRGRRARWHGILSQFRLSVEYIKGKDNVVADGLSRWAYPAGEAEDVSWHGDEASSRAVKEMITKELEEGRVLAVWAAALGSHGVLCLAGGKGEEPSGVERIELVEEEWEGDINRVARAYEHYELKAQYYQEVLEALGVTPTVDAFAEEKNAKVARFWTAQDSAFGHP
jgi:hypothetical protein